jgi:type I restriction enzyme S subunit
MRKQYEKYKDSSFDFIGKIPYKWELVPLKHISSISKGKKPIEDFQDFQNGMLPYLSMEFLRDQNSSPVYVKKDDPSVIFVEENDLLVLWDGSNAGEIVKAKKGALSSTMGKIHLINRSLNLNFLSYYLKASEVHLKNNTVGMGIPHINGGLLRNLPILKPTIGEQTQIARFLNHQTTIIDEIIWRKEKQIGLLKEKRQSIINEVVTKGLHPNAKMKDSGIEWLGKIPDHWSVLSLNKVIEVKDGTHDTPNYVDIDSPDCFPLITSKDFKNGEIDFMNAKYISKEDHLEIIKRSNTELGDILMSMIGGNIGNLMFVNSMINFSIKNVALFKTSTNQILGKFLFYILKSNLLQIQIDLKTRGGAQGFLALSDLRKLVFFRVEEKEMKEICNYLDKSVDKFEELLNMLEAQINTLKEYRQSLISEVVTGKIDVRDWQPEKDYKN